MFLITNPHLYMSPVYNPTVHQSNEPTEHTPPFTDEEVHNVVAFLAELRSIHADLIFKGYIFVDGEYVPPAGKHS